MNNTDILEEDVKNILNCCIDIETLISLDERAKEDLKNNTHNIQQQEVLTIIREFIRCKNDCSTLIAENKELKEENEGLKTKLDTLIEKYKELKEELDSVKQIYYTQREIEENYILKSKVEEVIEEVKKDENPSISSFQEYAQEYAIEKLQSLLGKE